MPRPRQLVLAASLAAFAVGCAHCDTCDDFPAPCTGPNCGYPYQSAFPFDGGSHIEPIVTGPAGAMYPAEMAPGTVVSPAPNGAPSISTPAPTPAQQPSQAPSQPSGNGGTSPPTLPDRGADPFNIPLPPADSPFSS